MLIASPLLAVGIFLCKFIEAVVDGLPENVLIEKVGAHVTVRSIPETICVVDPDSDFFGLWDSDCKF